MSEKKIKFENLKEEIIKICKDLLSFSDRKCKVFKDKEQELLDKLNILNQYSGDQSLVDGLYTRVIEHCLDNNLNVMFRFDRNKLKKSLPSFQGERKLDVAVMNACLDGVVILEQEKILSDLFMDYAPQMSSDAFWKTYYGIYQHNPEIAENLKKSRYYFIDHDFMKFDNGNMAYKRNVNIERLIERFIQDSLENFKLNYKSYLIARQSFPDIYEPTVNYLANFDKLYEVAKNPERFNETQIVGIYKQLLRSKNIEDMNAVLYDMLSSARQQAATSIVKSVKNFKLSSLKNSEINNVKVYHLNNDAKVDFLVHTEFFNYGDENELYERFIDIKNSEKNYVMSMSYVGSDNVEAVYGAGEEKIIFGFNGINPDNIAHISPVDSFSLSVKDERQLSYQPQYWTTPEKLKKYTGVYNEVNYVCPNKYEEGDLMPSFIISSSLTPKNNELKVAKKFGIPIICCPVRALNMEEDQETKKARDFAKQSFFPEVQKKYEQRER